MIKVAIPIRENSLSEYVSTASYFEVYTIEEQKVLSKERVMPSFNTLLTLPLWLKNIGISDLITRRLDKSILNLFAALKINVFVGVKANKSSELINCFLEGSVCSDKDTIEEIIKTNK